MIEKKRSENESSKELGTILKAHPRIQMTFNSSHTNLRQQMKFIYARFQVFYIYSEAIFEF